MGSFVQLAVSSVVQGGANESRARGLGSSAATAAEGTWGETGARLPRRHVSSTIVCKYVVVMMGLAALIVATFLNLQGVLNLDLAVYSGVLLSRIVLVLAIGISVFALRIALKALWCWALSVRAARGHAISYRTLIFLPLVWNDYDDAEELGCFLTGLAVLISLIPVAITVFTVQGYSTTLTYGVPVNISRDVAGHGGCNGGELCMLTSNMLLPNETQRLMQVDPTDQPRYFCATTQRKGSQYLSTVYVPTWPYPVPEAMGSRGQRITIRGIHGFRFDSTCNCTDSRRMSLPRDFTIRRAFDMGGGDFFASGQRLAADYQTLTYDLLYSFNGNTSCRAIVQRARMSATWIINSTGYYVENCFDALAEPMGNLETFRSLYRHADTWLYLTNRNTLRQLVRGPLTLALMGGASTDYAYLMKVKQSLVHVTTYLFATSRGDDPAHISSSFGGTVTYTAWPIDEYCKVSPAVFVLLILTFAAFLLSGFLRMIPHGFHGGSISQLFYLCRNLSVLKGWAHDLFHPDPARCSTEMLLHLTPDGDAFEVVGSSAQRAAMESLKCANCRV